MCGGRNSVAGVHTSLPGFQMPDEERVHDAAEAFRLLADSTRIKILWALLQGESSVACLAELVDAAPTAVSQHLAKLRLTGVVRGRRQGTFVFYTVADDHVRDLLTAALAPSAQGGPAAVASEQATASP